MILEQFTIEDLLSGKVRLEFGNKGQLTAIKIYEKQTEEELNRCRNCRGEGVVECHDCRGTGERSK